jgi:aryl-alcohol dehydrogenase-like predicted oxidoreductase
MELRALGRTGMRTPPLAFGGNVFGWTADEKTSHALLDAYVDAGFNLVDTADVYSTWVPGHAGGESETIIGRWIATRGQRDRLLIATKVGKPMGAGNRGLSAAYIARAVDASLRRLNTDYIDLYQSHDFDPDTPLEETLGAFARLIDAGKVRWIGASNHSAAQFAQALDVSKELNLPRYRTLQPLYNLYDRAAFEGELAALCAREDIGVISYYALASGFLTGKYRSADPEGQSSPRAAGAAKYATDAGLRIIDTLEQIGDAHGASIAATSLAWLRAQPTVVAPIASARTVEQVPDLLAGARLELTADEVEALDRVSAWTPTTA